MSASSQINVDADAVRRSIAADVRAGSAALAEFSRRYARTPEDKNAALDVKASIPDIEDPVILAELRSRMMDILGNILADFAREDVHTDDKLQARKRLFGLFRREASKQEAICCVEKLE